MFFNHFFHIFFFVCRLEKGVKNKNDLYSSLETVDIHISTAIFFEDDKIVLCRVVQIRMHFGRNTNRWV